MLTGGVSGELWFLEAPGTFKLGSLKSNIIGDFIISNELPPKDNWFEGQTTSKH